MPNNKLIAFFMFLATVAIALYGLITASKEKKKKKAEAEQNKEDAEIIPIEPRLAQRRAAALDDEFYALDDNDLIFLRVRKDGEGEIADYSFDVMRNHDTHYILSVEQMDRIIAYFNETTSADYTVDALRGYLGDGGETALERLFETLEISYEFKEAEITERKDDE